MLEVRQLKTNKLVEKSGDRANFPIGEPGGNTVHGRPAGDVLSLRTFSIYRSKSC